MRIELPDGQWAEIKENPDDLTGADEAKVRSAMKIVPGPDGKGFVTDAGGPAEMEFAMLARVITSWSLPQAINLANIRELKRGQLRPLREAIKPHMLEMGEDKDPNPTAGS